MMTIRPADARGVSGSYWLDSRHSFSFGNYSDPAHMGFGPLRVINEDWIAPGAGFDTHPHRDMEILTYVLEGALEHRDSMGNSAIIRPGEVQRMSAGTGVRHSERNASPDAPVHLLQIWLLPEQYGIAPGYAQKDFTAETQGRLRLVASRDGADGALTVHQDAALHVARLDAGATVEHRPAPGRKVWVQVARGDVALNGADLQAGADLHEGDGAAVEGEANLTLRAGAAGAEVLLFDMA